MFVSKFFRKLGISVADRLHNALVLCHSRRTPLMIRERLLSLLLYILVKILQQMDQHLALARLVQTHMKSVIQLDQLVIMLFFLVELT